MQSIRWSFFFPGSIVLIPLKVLIGFIPNLNTESFANSIHNPVRVDIYVLPSCPCSKRALNLLDSSHIKYNFYIIKMMMNLKKISLKSSVFTFHQIFINNLFIIGYSKLSDLSAKGDLIKIIY